MKSRIKYFSQRPLHQLQRLTSRRNAIFLTRIFSAFILILTLYSFIFHYLMRLESRSYSIVSGFYWLISTMTTLGIGDIVFESDTGRLFTVIVSLSGVLFLLILLPFTIFQLFQSSARIPRELPEGTRGHVVITEYNPLTSALVERLRRFNQPYAVLVPDLEEATQLKDKGIKTVMGELDDAESYRELRIDHAAFVVATGTDETNTTLAYAVRQVSATVPMIATASGTIAQHVLENAGCTYVLALDEMMGQSLARRIIAGDAMAHVIGVSDDMVIAEAAAANTPLVGKTVEQAHASHLVDASIIGLWERGTFSLPTNQSMISEKSILVIVGTQPQIDRYNELFCIYNISSAPIMIIGGGSVGRALGRAMQERDLEYRIIERKKALVPDEIHVIIGEATDVDVLKQAGFFEAPAVAINSHDDQTNIYLTTFFRHLRKDIQIISRATLDRSIHTLHSAGCDFVVSHASLGANNILNLSKRGNILMIAEGVDVFRVKTPKMLAGKSIRYAAIREHCGCDVIGISAGGTMMINPYIETTLPAGGEMILIGSVESEEKFFRRFRPIAVE